MTTMVKIYYDKDADLSILKRRTITIIGYGNQGRAWAMNLRDSGVSLIVGNVKDRYWEVAEGDGFEVQGVKEAAERGDIVCVLVPDEVQSKVYEEGIKDTLRPRKALVFAHGFSIHYGLIKPPEDVDVILIAPRMIGVGVREMFEKGSGAPAMVGIEQDASGKARDLMLALAKGLGFTRAGVVESSFEEETELDLFSEQAIWSAILGVFLKAYDVLTEAGYSSEAVVLEMLASGEMIECAREIAKLGLIKQLRVHSRTSQYGQLSRIPRFATETFVDAMKESLREIRLGCFAKEWLAEQQHGYPVFDKLKKNALRHPVNKAQEEVAEGIVIDYDVL